MRAWALLVQKGLQWRWRGGKARCRCRRGGGREARRDGGREAPTARRGELAGRVRRLCMPPSFLPGGGRGADSVITKCAAPRKGLPWRKGNAARDQQLLLCFPLLWVNVECGRAAALLWYKILRDIKWCLPSESQ